MKSVTLPTVVGFPLSTNASRLILLRHASGDSPLISGTRINFWSARRSCNCGSSFRRGSPRPFPARPAPFCRWYGEVARRWSYKKPSRSWGRLAKSYGNNALSMITQSKERVVLELLFSDIIAQGRIDVGVSGERRNRFNPSPTLQ